MEFGFLLKKIIAGFLMPLSFGLIIGFIGLYFLFRKRLKKAKIFLAFSLIWITLMGYAPFADLLVAPLETQYKSLKEIPKDVKYIVLLGGDMENRAWEVLRLYHYIDNAKIITSGYEARGDAPEAFKTRKKLIRIGIPPEDIIVFPKPKDTKEEADRLKEYLHGDRFILVTSAYHLPRAMALFHHEGLEPIASTSHFLIKDSDRVISAPSAVQLEKSEVAIHEYLGFLWAKIRGQI
jgi:uncharacterized SAM-binding protein YcdF (DUF218 family)